MSEDLRYHSSQSSNRWEIGDRLPSTAAVEAVAAVRGVDPTEMDDSLAEYVDPDALDTLLEHSTTGLVSVEFQMDGEIVELRNDGKLDVSESGD